MENLTKIDVIGNDIFCYNEETNERKNYVKDESMNVFFERFSTNEDLLTVNETNPFKRIMKFFRISDSIPESFEEIDYSELSVGDKNIFDNFVSMIKAK